MKLTELNPEFLRWERVFRGEPDIKPKDGDFSTPYEHDIMHGVDKLEESQGIWFDCPVCTPKGRGHQVLVGFSDRGLLPEQASQSRNGGPSRWEVSGSSFEDLTTKPSIDCICWHGFITNGEVT